MSYTINADGWYAVVSSPTSDSLAILYRGLKVGPGVRTGTFLEAQLY